VLCHRVVGLSANNTTTSTDGLLLMQKTNVPAVTCNPLFCAPRLGSNREPTPRQELWPLRVSKSLFPVCVHNAENVEVCICRDSEVAACKCHGRRAVDGGRCHVFDLEEALGQCGSALNTARVLCDMEH
jgi:hypothetical protein